MDHDNSSVIGIRDLRRFGLLLGSIFAVLFGIVIPLMKGRGTPMWPWAVLLILTAWSLLLPATLRPVYRAWILIGHYLGWINTRIILGIVFFVVIFPIGIIRRLAGDPLSLSIDKGAETYRVKSKQRPIKHMERPF